MGEQAKQNPKPDDPEQSKRFEETARQVDVDETGKAFKKAIKAVAPAKLASSSPKTRKPPSNME